jgi:hypothetical protein
MGVKGDVVVKVTHGHSQGFFKKGSPYLWHLSHKRIPYGNPRRMKMIGNASGWVECCIPRLHAVRGVQKSEIVGHCPWQMVSRHIVETAMHEMAHVAQHREGEDQKLIQPEWNYKRIHGRRPPHRKRPIEVDAENRLYDVKQTRLKQIMATEQIIEAMLIDTVFPKGSDDENSM